MVLRRRVIERVFRCDYPVVEALLLPLRVLCRRTALLKVLLNIFFGDATVLPVPRILAGSMSFSANKRRTESVARHRHRLLQPQPLRGAASSASPATKLAITCSAVTVSPSCAKISLRAPSAGATTSSTTLSVSISTRF